jgi:hypothetical protein
MALNPAIIFLVIFVIIVVVILVLGIFAPRRYTGPTVFGMPVGNVGLPSIGPIGGPLDASNLLNIFKR